MPRSRCSPGRCIAPCERRTCSVPAPGTGTREDTTQRTSRTLCIPQDRWLHYLAVGMPFLPSHFRCTRLALEPALTLAVVKQFIVKLGMSNLNERLSPLADRASMQVGNTVFRDDILHVGARRQHARAMRQPRHDARYGFLFGGRWQRDDGLTPPGACRPADEIELAAKAAVEMRPD